MLIRTLLLSSVLALLIACSNSDSGESPAEPTQDTGQDTAQGSVQDVVTTTASGLKYEVLRAADGASPGPESTVTVHYLGKFTDGRQFDSSYDRNQPATFPMNGVIPGFAEGLQLMNVGSQYRLTIPPNLAYGERGTDTIPPNSILIFDIELLEINSN